MATPGHFLDTDFVDTDFLTDPDVVITDAIHHWRLDETSGNIFTDFGSAGLDGVGVGIDDSNKIQGRVGLGALRLFNAPEEVNVPGSASTTAFIQNTNVYSINFWLFNEDDTHRHHMIGTGIATTSKGFFAIIERTAGGFPNPSLRMRAVNGTGIIFDAHSEDLTGNLLVNGWNHFVITGSGTGNTTSMWVNGISQTVGYQTSYTTPSTGDSSNDLMLGNVDDSVTHMRGALDDVRIFDRPITELEVQALGSLLPTFPSADGIRDTINLAGIIVCLR